ncbi:MAG: metallopeptidase family protein [Leptospirillia bacterium]
MSPEAFDEAVEKAVRALPDAFRERLDNVVFLVEEWPDESTMKDMELESEYDLLGLYTGWPVTERGTDYHGTLPDTIHIYRQPTLAYCEDMKQEVVDCIADTVIHEVGHFYGLSDPEMEAIEAACEWQGGTPPRIYADE